MELLRGKQLFFSHPDAEISGGVSVVYLTSGYRVFLGFLMSIPLTKEVVEGEVRGENSGFGKKVEKNLLKL